MSRAVVHPSYVVAVRTCVFVHSEEIAHTLTPDLLLQWDEAMDAWFAKHPDGR